ncbi:MAG TPA: hypothetical protein VGG44_02490, partial [Tepidisphaeraceae bacterium]
MALNRVKSSLGAWLAIPLVILLSWLVFCMAAAANYYDKTSPGMMSLFIVLGIAPLVITRIAADFRTRWWPSLCRRLEEHTQRLDALPPRHLGIWVALAAGAGLYLELVLIRYHGTCFAVFGFFKNLSLLSCFLGLGMGYALGRTRLVLTPLVLPLLAVQLIVTHLLQFSDIASTMGNPIFEQRAMGLPTVSGISHIVLVYAFLIWIFAFNAVCLVPLGQLASHLMGRGAKLTAYSWNLVGSIVAVLLFWGLSYLWTPPVIWFAVGFLTLLPFLRGVRGLSTAIAIAVLGLVGTSFNLQSYDLYSPYQILTVLPAQSDSTMIMVNHFYYQGMFDLSPQGPGMNGNRAIEKTYYDLPYLFEKSPRDVLIVGSGSGNDAASAVRHGAGHVDAVEIDSLILRLGQLMHPEAPYASDHVTPHVQDARAYFRFTDKKYDLIVYGLLDSHTSLSAMSGVRLDSYIYTVEAFRQARKCLKDGGILCLSFASATEEFGAKLSLMLKEAFDGRQPRVFVAPMPVGATVFVIGKDAQAAPAVVPPGILDMT